MAGGTLLIEHPQVRRVREGQAGGGPSRRARAQNQISPALMNFQLT